MTQDRVPPPPEAACLYRPYPSSQKGGTRIAEGVEDVATHERLVAANGYRPDECPTCQHPVMHVHDYRTRLLQLAAACLSVRVVRHRCASKTCGARWQTLPAFIARHLWFNWPIVEDAAGETLHRVRTATRWPSARTIQRWHGRLSSSGRRLLQVFATSGGALSRVAQQLGLDATRRAVVSAVAQPLHVVAAVIHRFAPGARLM